MPRRYTTKLKLEKLNSTLRSERRRKAELSDLLNDSDEEDDEDDDDDDDDDDMLLERGDAPIRGILENTAHYTHPMLNQGLGQSVDAERTLNIFPSCAFTVPLPLYVAQQTTPIVDPCLLRARAHDDWVTQLNKTHSYYTRHIKHQKQREKKLQNNIHSVHVFDMAEHIASNENSYFRDSYDYYYTGGNLNYMPYAGKTLAVHVSGEKLRQLHLSTVGAEAELWRPLHSETLNDISSEIFELIPLDNFRVNHGNMFLARMLKDIAIYELQRDEDEDEDGPEDQPHYNLNCQSKFSSQEAPFISVAQAFNKPNTLAIACQDRSVRFLDIITQQDISKHNVCLLKGVSKHSTWAQLRSWQDHCFFYACQSVLLTIDQRCANEALNPCFASSVHSQNCENFSCVGRSLNPNLIYVASNHKLHCLDMRCLGKKLTDRSVVTWTHQMVYSPTFMDAIAHNGSEFVALGNALSDDQRICELKGVLAQSMTEMCSPSLPYSPTQLDESLMEARLQGCDVNIYADLTNRLRCSKTGLKFHRLENVTDGAFAQLLTASSVGDIFCQRVTDRDEREIQEEQRTGVHTNEAVLYYADQVLERVQRKLHCTEVQPMAVMREIMKSEAEQDVEQEKPLVIEDVNIDYGFSDSESDSEEESDDHSIPEEQPTTKQKAASDLAKKKEKEKEQQIKESKKKGLDVKVIKKKAVNRGPWQKSAYRLNRHTDFISARLLSIWDIDEFDLNRDVQIDMIDDKLKYEKTETDKVDRTAAWLQQMSEKPDDATEDKQDVVPGTNLPTYFEAVRAEYREVTNETIDINTTVKVEAEPSFIRQPHSTLRSGEFTIIETDFEVNPRPAKRAKTKYSMGF